MTQTCDVVMTIDIKTKSDLAIGVDHKTEISITHDRNNNKGVSLTLTLTITVK